MWLLVIVPVVRVRDREIVVICSQVKENTVLLVGCIVLLVGCIVLLDGCIVLLDGYHLA